MAGGQCGGTKLFENYIVKVFGVSPSTVLVVLLTCTTHLMGYVLPSDVMGAAHVNQLGSEKEGVK
jgi:hypothetical protein